MLTKKLFVFLVGKWYCDLYFIRKQWLSNVIIKQRQTVHTTKSSSCVLYKCGKVTPISNFDVFNEIHCK